MIIPTATRWYTSSFSNSVILWRSPFLATAENFCAVCCTRPHYAGALLVSVRYWLIWSLANVGLSGHSYPECQADSFPIVCTVLALYSWNYYSGEQGPTVQHFSLNVCLTWLHWKRKWFHLVAKWFILKVAVPSFVGFSFIYIVSCIKKIRQSCKYWPVWSSSLEQ